MTKAEAKLSRKHQPFEIHHSIFLEIPRKRWQKCAEECAANRLGRKSRQCVGIGQGHHRGCPRRAIPAHRGGSRGDPPGHAAEQMENFVETTAVRTLVRRGMRLS